MLVGLAALGARAEPATFAARVAPILEKNCTVCHGAEKQKAGLRLDSFDAIIKGSKEGAVVNPRDVASSELHRRITLPPADDDFMPSEGKPPLAPDEIAVLEKWIAAGVPATEPFDAPALIVAKVEPPAAPDYHARLAACETLARTLGVQLVPRSRVPTDGLVLRTASAPARCDDAALAKLAPVADLIVEAELARTKITDAGVATLTAWSNLRTLDVSHTAVSSAGLAPLAALKKLEWLNVSETRVDETGVAQLREWPALHRVWAFAEPPAPAPATAQK